MAQTHVAISFDVQFPSRDLFGTNDYVYSEEIIDKRMIKASRIWNEKLQTIDYIVASENVIIFRTVPQEKPRLILQLGTASAETALQAALVVQDDVAAIDINMGCPKKFSLQGGMGAALLSNPDTACDIIRTLSTNLSVPVTAKIRVLETMEETVTFMKRLEEAGAAAITVHLRTKSTSSNSPANWDALAALVKAVSVPVLANGDVYTIADVEYLLQTTGCAGVMIARPALLNISLLTKPEGPLKTQPMEELRRGGPYGEYVSVTPEQVACWKTLREIIHDFLEESVKYDPPFQIVKYTIQEMMSQRRHCQERLCGLSFGRMNNIYQAISASKTLSEMCEVFELPDLAERARHLPSLTKKRSRAESQREALGQAVEQEQEQESVPLRPDHRFESSYFDETDVPQQDPPASTVSADQSNTEAPPPPAFLETLQLSSPVPQADSV